MHQIAASPLPDIADGEDAGVGGGLSFYFLHLEGIGVHLDAKAVVGDAGLLQAEVLDVGCATCCHEDDIGFHAFRLALALEGHHAPVDLLHAGTHEELDAALLELLAQTLGNVAVHGGQAFLEVFHHRHFAAEAGEGAGKLHADDACTDDAKGLGNFLYVEEFGGGDAVRSGDAWNGKNLCA